MNVSDRVKEIRKKHKLSQVLFGERLRVSRDVVNNIENNRVDLSELILKAICVEFNVNEGWLRTGQGEMDIEPDTFSLDEYVKKRGMTDLELDIVKTYLELDPQIRQVVMNHFKNRLGKKYDNKMAVTYNNDDIFDSVAEAESKYKKNVLKNASKTEHIALNTTEEKKKKSI